MGYKPLRYLRCLKGSVGVFLRAVFFLCEEVGGMDQLLHMQDITKVYPNGVVASKKVSLEVKKGEIHALVGENGAGKTTLMKILFGLEKPDEGHILYKGKELKVTSPLMAIKEGIGMVHQHFMLAPSLTVAENLVLGAEPKKGLAFDFVKAVETTRDLGKKYNLPVDPQARVEDIPIGMRQKLEILKALLRGADLLVLDEPTAVLTPQETEELFLALLELKRMGHTMIFISHKLKEVKQITDRITVLRGGRLIGVAQTKEVNEADISRMMVGRDVILQVQKTPAVPKEEVLSVEDLSYRSEDGKEVLKGISFAVRKGEVLGIAGVEGNGQRELVEILTGLRRASSGRVLVEGNEVERPQPKLMRTLGVSHIPEDRMVHGVAKEASIEENLISDRYDTRDYGGLVLTNYKAIRKLAADLISSFDIRAKSSTTAVKSLSGGNIQKVVVAREFSSSPLVVIANQPTRGVDVGAIEFIHQQLVSSCRKGAGGLLISADLNEVMSVSDRLLVIYNGEIVGNFSDASLVTEEELGLYMLGLKREDKKDKEGVS